MNLRGITRERAREAHKVSLSLSLLLFSSALLLFFGKVRGCFVSFYFVLLGGGLVDFPKLNAARVGPFTLGAGEERTAKDS